MSGSARSGPPMVAQQAGNGQQEPGEAPLHGQHGGRAGERGFEGQPAAGVQELLEVAGAYLPGPPWPAAQAAGRWPAPIACNRDSSPPTVLR